MAEQWEKVEASSDIQKYLRGTHTLWSRVVDGQYIFTVLPNGITPQPNDGGYYTISAALKTKGMAS